MPPLPAKLPEGLQDNHHAVSAYNICLQLQKSIQEEIDKKDSERKDIDKKDDEIRRNIISCRILGYLIHFVTQEIFSCKDNESFVALGQTYYNFYIKAFRSNKGRTPAPSSHPSRRSFDNLKDIIGGTLVEAPQSHVNAKANALIRDNFRCVVTRRYDDNSVRQNKELEEIYKSDPHSMTAETQCAHIFAESTNANIAPGSDKRDCATGVLAVLKRFGFTKIEEDLNGRNVHRLENVMTLEPSVHSSFDKLKIWFIATNVENRYKVTGTHEFMLRQYPEYVTFSTPDPIKLPVPSPTYLAIHAACAQVAHLSGASEYIDKFDRDMEDGTTLDHGGGSAELLEDAIWGLGASGHEVII
ncbi:hypothetical protein BDQ12DRAFT_707890 [Crucibulum laeve]|uniref:HNH nuclease domain-containing protein n=1 Tax=Crucibulum laeve TaxID=68775 RepID=A0A5C3LFV1_9AGAR|nr:hypothetical protein BDQ12DRAFT_707890 [Crucibulum laeve]